MLGVAAGGVENVEHSLRTGVVERVDNDGGRALAVGVGGEPSGDGVARPFVVGRVGEVMSLKQIVIEQDQVVVAFKQPADRLRCIASDVQLVADEPPAKPMAAVFVVFDDEDARCGADIHR